MRNRRRELFGVEVLGKRVPDASLGRAASIAVGNIVQDEDMAICKSVLRPLLVGNDFVLVGFKEAEWESRLKK